MFVNDYGGLVWTNHARERMQSRNLTQAEVYDAITNPTTSTQGSDKGSIKYRKVTPDKLIEAIIKDENGRRLVLTCWGAPNSKFKATIPLWEKLIRKLFSAIFK